MELIVVLIIILGSYLYYRFLEEKDRREDDKLWRSVEGQREEIREKDEKRYKKLIGSTKQKLTRRVRYFRIPPCSRCGDEGFKLLESSEIGSGIRVRCRSCEKIMWVKYIGEDVPQILNNFNTLIQDYYNYQDQYLQLQTTDLMDEEDDSWEDQYYYCYSDIGYHDRDDDAIDRYITQYVKDKVWRRDRGRCVQCRSTEKLEFDHIIPVSKGGNSTYRNVQLLCEKCNREKSDRI